jgi:hypothetical protein
VKSAHGRFEASGEYRRAIPRTHTSEELGREERVARKVGLVPCRQEKMIDLLRSAVVELEHQLIAARRDRADRVAGRDRYS